MIGVMPDPSHALSDQVVLGEVLPGSPAEKAGLKAGDRIVKLDGEPLGDWKDLTDRVGKHQPGDKVALEILPRTSGGAWSSTDRTSIAKPTCGRWPRNSSPAKSSRAPSSKRAPRPLP